MARSTNRSVAGHVTPGCIKPSASFLLQPPCCQRRCHVVHLLHHIYFSTCVIRTAQSQRVCLLELPTKRHNRHVPATSTAVISHMLRCCFLVYLIYIIKTTWTRLVAAILVQLYSSRFSTSPAFAPDWNASPNRLSRPRSRKVSPAHLPFKIFSNLPLP